MTHIEKPTGPALTLKDAISRTLSLNPALAIYEHQINAQKAQVSQAGLSPKPRVTLMVEDAFGTGEQSSIRDAQTTLSIAWVLDADIKSRRVDVANYRRMAKENDRTIQQLSLASNVGKIYLEALYYQSALVIQQQAIDNNESMIRVTEALVNAGQSAETPLHLAKARLINAELTYDSLDHDRMNFFHKLAFMWSATEPDFASLNGQLDKRPTLKPYAELIEYLTRNPSVTQFLTQARIAEAEQRLALQKREPLWRVMTGVRRHEATDEYSLLASISTPLGGENDFSGEINAASSRADAYQAQARSTLNVLHSSLYVAYQEVTHFTELAEALSHKLIPQLEQALTSATHAYKAGQGSARMVFDIQDQLIEAKQQKLDANYAAYINQLIIEQLIAAPITETLKPSASQAFELKPHNDAH